MLARMDSFLLGKAQKLCDTFQRLTGFTKFRIEKWLIVAAGAAYWMFAIETLVPAVALIALVFSFSCIFMIREIESEERAFLARQELRHNINHSCTVRIMSLVLYSSFLGFSIFLMEVGSAHEQIWFCAWTVSVLARIYFSACIPRPPGKSKVREWLEKGLQGLNSLLPEPEPIPIPSR